MLAGALAGLIAGLLVAFLEGEQGMLAPGLLGLTPSSTALAPYLLFALGVGAAFGAIFRYRPRSYATNVTSGLLFGMLWWVLGSLTLAPLASRHGPTWSLATAQDAFPFLIGDLLYGGLTGLGAYLLAWFWHRAWPLAGPTSEESAGQRVRIVVLGGGFAGVTAAQRLEELPEADVTLVSDSNYLLFTPMLAEVASSALEPQLWGALISSGGASAVSQ